MSFQIALCLANASSGLHDGSFGSGGLLVAVPFAYSVALLAMLVLRRAWYWRYGAVDLSVGVHLAIMVPLGGIGLLLALPAAGTTAMPMLLNTGGALLAAALITWRVILWRSPGAAFRIATALGMALCLVPALILGLATDGNPFAGSIEWLALGGPWGPSISVLLFAGFLLESQARLSLSSRNRPRPAVVPAAVETTEPLASGPMPPAIKIALGATVLLAIGEVLLALPRGGVSVFRVLLGPTIPTTCGAGLLVIGLVGLLKRRVFGWYTTLAMGSWMLFDGLVSWFLSEGRAIQILLPTVIGLCVVLLITLQLPSSKRYLSVRCPNPGCGSTKVNVTNFLCTELKCRECQHSWTTSKSLRTRTP